MEKFFLHRVHKREERERERDALSPFKGCDHDMSKTPKNLI